ncbi:PREDICTED: myb-like protein X [Camelina sativa]|uniref:Myb-like protein X n=1 Tax=Camelina sativa TaxID=90675 RepID=A0ABM0V5A8_CAMSA|nr:PREDICTED: myb-like protein X [Camelina sativa]
MSRCFPFPPPGYDKKFTTDESDSLLKEKLKEKKHKKEKKDKEEKEGKEKKDKEKSKDKHKERKEKKEKHKDRKDKDRDKEKSRTLEDRKATGVLLNNGDKEKLVPNTLQSNGNGDSKFIQDLARRIRDEEATESQSLRKIDIPSGVTESNNFYSVPQTNHTKVDEKRISTHKNSAMAKRSESPVLRVSSCMDQKGAEVIFKSVVKKDQAKRKELLEKNHRRESVTKSDKPLINGEIKKSEPNNITDRSSKEKKTEVMNKNVLKKPKFVEGGPRLKGREHDVVDTRDFRESDHPKAGVKNLTAEGILGKRKDLQTNGFLYENGSKPNEIPTPVGSSIASVENGRNSVACQTHPKLVSELQEIVTNPEVKEQKINGFFFSQEVKCHSPVSSGKVKERVEVSARKRPHSDLKYLDQLLNVPKREELPEVDDDEQEWLFGQSGVRLLKKQRADYTNSVVENPEVWNQALRIESADILALPYVVPF